MKLVFHFLLSLFAELLEYKRCLSRYLLKSLHVMVAFFVFPFSLTSPLYSLAALGSSAPQKTSAMACSEIQWCASPHISDIAYFLGNRFICFTPDKCYLLLNLSDNFKILILIQSLDSSPVEYSQTLSHFPTFWEVCFLFRILDLILKGNSGENLRKWIQSED